MWYFSPYLASSRLTGYVLWTLFWLPVIITLSVRARRAAARGAVNSASRDLENFMQFYWRMICRMLGLKLTVHGIPSTNRPCLFVSNHSSYLDIAVLSAVLPVSFVAKKEIESWPIFGFLAKQQRTVFIERQGRHARMQRDALNQRLSAQDNLVLFPEGTSSDGQRLLAFRSSLFAAAMDRNREDASHQDHEVSIQAVSLTYTQLDGIPLGRHLRPLFAWYGDMSLIPHLWRMAGVGQVRAELIFHPPAKLSDFASRKALASHCQKQVERGLMASLTGRTLEARGHNP